MLGEPIVEVSEGIKNGLDGYTAVVSRNVVEKLSAVAQAAAFLMPLLGTLVVNLVKSLVKTYSMQRRMG